MAARVALGVSNLDMETMQSSGKSYEEVLRGRAKEIALQDELGVRDSTREPLVQQAVFTPAKEEKPAEVHQAIASGNKHSLNDQLKQPQLELGR